MEILSVDNIAFNILGYPMSYIEFIGTVLYLWSAWLIARRNMLTWPVSIVSVLLYMSLFYQIRLYADAIEQIYYLVAGMYGWWLWNKYPETPDDTSQTKPFRFSSPKGMALVLIMTMFLSAVSGVLIEQADVILPTIFLEPAEYPYLDAITTMMSFVAMWLMIQKRVESWVYWIVIDIIGVWLYFVKDVRFISLLYVILLINAVYGLVSWTRKRQVEKE